MPFITANNRRWAALGLIASLSLAAASCGRSDPPPRNPAPKPSLFVAQTMRLHPIFSRVADDDGKGNGQDIVAELEFADQFGDPVKAEGRVLFELFTFRRDNPDPRGQRLLNPFQGTILTADEQKARWNRTSQTYSFRLLTPPLPRQNLVLTASFLSTSGQRLIDKVILLPPERADRPNSADRSEAPSPDEASAPTDSSTVLAPLTEGPAEAPTTQPE